MGKHTPGPWRMIDRCDDRGKPCGISIYANGTDEDQYGHTRDIRICAMPDGATVNGGHAWPDQLANARLIAAAPELLEALSEIMAEWDHNHKDETHLTGITPESYGLQLARQAIAKATE